MPKNLFLTIFYEIKTVQSKKTCPLCAFILRKVRTKKNYSEMRTKKSKQNNGVTEKAKKKDI